MYEEMMNNIITRLGHEDVRTIIFCGLVENGADAETIYETYDEYMNEEEE